jgi:hypothetical protein
MDKYGFVYIWYDRKHKRFYIGCHWGREDDGYICSSRWMRKAYRRRPEDFKSRRILSRIFTNRKDLLEDEYHWLQMIKDTELGVRYYNLSKKQFGHWYSSEEKRKTVGEKIAASPHRRERIAKALKGNTNGRGGKGKIISEETRKKLSVLNKGMLGPNKGRTFSDKVRENMSIAGSNRKRKLRCITDGYINTRIPLEEEIPSGWFLGVTLNKNKMFIA